MTPRLALLLALLAAPAAAQQPMPGMNHPTPSAAPPAAAGESPATAALRQANEAMMRNMATTPTGNPDHDFVAGMLPHHQGAVDMARIELQYGKDPALRRLAQSIIASQEKEIRFMRDWLRRHPTP